VTEAMPNVVHCQSLTRRYGAVVAVDAVTCSVAAGDRVVLIGPSGSGKSTLLQMMGGVETPSAGTITWPALGAREDLRPGAVSIIFQGSSLLPPLDVTENVALPLLLGGVSEADAFRAARAALASLQLDALADKLPEQLSGGQAQRVAAARVIAGSPRLVLADEPTGQLDQQTARHLLDVLDDAVRLVGAALVLTTHDRRVADRFAAQWTMSDGRLTMGTA
jgi:ABC-type lipoprotein export system ATPase subunit